MKNNPHANKFTKSLSTLSDTCKSCLWPELARISELLNASIYNLEATLTTIVQVAIRLTYASRGFILLYQEGEDKKLGVEVALDREYKVLSEPEKKLSWSIVEEVIETGKPVVISDLTESEFNLADSVKKMNLLSAMCVPLKIPNQGIPKPQQNLPPLTLTAYNGIMGVIYVDKSLLVHEFTQDELTLFKTLANNANAAIINAKLFKHYLQKKEVEEGLKVAQNVQEMLLPKNPPKAKNLDVSFWNLPCHETGGNYFDFIFLSENELAFVIGAVPGHSFGGAILMASARSFLHALFEHYHDIGEIFFHLNNLLKRDTDSQMVMSLFIGVIDVEKMVMQYINAGHIPPLFYHSFKNEVRYLELTSPNPLGLMWDTTFDTRGSILFERGDILLLATEGIWKVNNKAQEPFGKKRLEQLISESKQEKVGDICEIIQQAILFHKGEEGFKNDMTLIVIKAVQESVRLRTPHDYIQCGLTSMKVKDFDKAIMYFKRAKKISPTSLVDAHFALGIAYIEKHLWSKAVRELEKVLKIKPDFPNVDRYYELAVEQLAKEADSEAPDPS